MRLLSLLLVASISVSSLTAQAFAIRDPYGNPAIHQITFSPDGQYVYGADALSNIFRISVRTGVLDLLADHHEMTVRAMDREGNVLVTADGNQVVNYWDASTGEHVYRMPIETEVASGFICLDVGRFSGTMILGTAQELIHIIANDPPQVEWAYSEHSFVKAVASDDQEDWFAISYGDRTIELVGRKNSETRFTIENQKIHSYDLAFQPGTNKLAFADGRRLSFVEAGGDFPITHSGIRFRTTLYSLEYSPDGQTIVVGDGRGEVFFIDVATDSILFRLQPDEQAINDLAFSPDGRWLLSADNEGIHWYDVQQQKMVAYTTTTDDSNGYIHISPDDFYDANEIGLDYIYYYSASENTFLDRPTDDPKRIEGLFPRLLAGEGPEALIPPEPGLSETPAGPATQATWNRAGKDRALFFAIDDYAEWPDLRNPVSDVEALASDLSERYGFITEVVKNPNKRTIYDKLEEYRQLSYDDDAQLLIFFSGHGAFNEGTEEGFLVPREGLLEDAYQESYIPHSRLAPRVDNIPCPHILLAIDACYSGTFDQRLSKDRGQPGIRPGDAVDARQAFVDRMLRDRSRLYLTSGGKERTPDGDRHSPFTEYWLRALRSYGGEDSILTFFELTAILEQAEPRPRFGPFGSHDIGGGFLFLAK